MNSLFFLGYIDIGDLVFTCNYCDAYMWYQERTKKDKEPKNPKFHLCCSVGNIELPLLINPPTVLRDLLFDHYSTKNKNFQQHIRTYNMIFAFTSLRTKLDRSFKKSAGLPSIKI